MTNLVDIDTLDMITQQIVYDAQIENSVCGKCVHNQRYYDDSYQCELRPTIDGGEMIELKKCGWRRCGEK